MPSVSPPLMSDKLCEQVSFTCVFLSDLLVVLLSFSSSLVCWNGASRPCACGYELPYITHETRRDETRGFRIMLHNTTCVNKPLMHEWIPPSLIFSRPVAWFLSLCLSLSHTHPVSMSLTSPPFVLTLLFLSISLLLSLISGWRVSLHWSWGRICRSVTWAAGCTESSERERASDEVSLTGETSSRAAGGGDRKGAFHNLLLHLQTLLFSH